MIVPKPSKVKKKKAKRPTLAKMRKILDRLWFENIYKRDKGCCKRCGRKDTLAGHHIFGKKAYPSGRWLVENGILLCYSCHIHFAHAKPYMFEEFMKECKGVIWWFDLHETVQLKSQFRACDFENIKFNLESELKEY
jgi:hypothetical protein